jgi:hypothetical protein
MCHILFLLLLLGATASRLFRPARAPARSIGTAGHPPLCRPFLTAPAPRISAIPHRQPHAYARRRNTTRRHSPIRPPPVRAPAFHRHRKRPAVCRSIVLPDNLANLAART